MHNNNGICGGGTTSGEQGDIWGWFAKGDDRNEAKEVHGMAVLAGGGNGDEKLDLLLRIELWVVPHEVRGEE
jgi:hypothetical protein